MKHFILALILSIAASSAFSGAVGGFTAGDAGIVTPDIALGMRHYERWNNDTAGGMVVCASPDHHVTRGGCDPWTPVAKVVPAGRTFVGFRIVSGAYGYRWLEVYWK